MNQHYTIQESDVGQPIIHAFDETWITANFIGRILPGDVGKRVFTVPDSNGYSFLQVENNEQRTKRIN